MPSRRTSRLAGRLLTGPLAFAAAGIADLVIYWVGVLEASVRRGPAATHDRKPASTMLPR